MRRSFLPIVFAALAVTAAGAPEDGPLRGVVLDARGRPLAGALVTLESPRGCCTLVPGHSFQSVRTDAEGRFALGEPPVAMDVRVTHPDHPPASAAARDGATVRLGDAAWIAGDAPAGAEVYVTHGLRRIASAAGGGAFRLGPLPAGETLTLHVLSPRHRPFRHVFAAGEGAGTVDVALDEGLALRGRVHPPRAGVVLRASQGEARESRAQSDLAGAFTLTGLRAGEVCVVVLDPLGETAPQVLTAAAGGHLGVEWPR